MTTHRRHPAEPRPVGAWSRSKWIHWAVVEGAHMVGPFIMPAALPYLAHCPWALRGTKPSRIRRSITGQDCLTLSAVSYVSLMFWLTVYTYSIIPAEIDGSIAGLVA